MYLDIAREEIPGGIELNLSGVLDANTFEELDVEVFNILENGESTSFLLGMIGVTGLSSAGAGALLSVSEQAMNAGGKVVLYGVTSGVLKTLTILGLAETTGKFHRHRLSIATDRIAGLQLLQSDQNLYAEPEDALTTPTLDTPTSSD